MSIKRQARSASRQSDSGIAISLTQALVVTALFGLACPALLLAGVIAYARFVRSSSVDIEWNVLGMFGDPLGLLLCAGVFVSVFLWRFKRSGHKN
jgi:hypothetical protein